MTTYAYVLTIQYPTPDGPGIGYYTDADTIDVPDGTSRHQVLVDLLAETQENVGASHADIVFWSLEPDTLGGVS